MQIALGGFGGICLIPSFSFQGRTQTRVMQIQTVDGEFEITDVLLQAWTTRFPAADLRREHPLMVLWLLKNPAKRPRNPIRFIENWLRRVQEREARNLAETSKRGKESAERIGVRYGVEPRPGESQEEYNRRVIAACAGSVVKPMFRAA